MFDYVLSRSLARRSYTSAQGACAFIQMSFYFVSHAHMKHLNSGENAGCVLMFAARRLYFSVIGVVVVLILFHSAYDEVFTTVCVCVCSSHSRRRRRLRCVSLDLVLFLGLFCVCVCCSSIALLGFLFESFLCPHSAYACAQNQTSKRQFARITQKMR